MYSLVMMMSMVGPAEAPQGILFHRHSSGCNGAAIQQAMASGCSGNSVQTVQFIQGYQAPATAGSCSGSSFATARPASLFGFGLIRTGGERRHPLRAIFGRLGERMQSRNCGCGGASASFSIGAPTYSTMPVGYAPIPVQPMARPAVKVTVNGAGCSCNGGCPCNCPDCPCNKGSATAGVNGAARPMAGGILERARVRMALRNALRSNTLTPEQHDIAVRTLGDPGAFEAAVSKTHQHLIHQNTSFGTIGDGTLLQKIFDNLPQLIAAFAEILKLLGH